MTLLENLSRLCAGGTCSAAGFLTLMETESEDALDQAFEYFTQNRVVIDLSDLPKFRAENAYSVRLRREEELAQKDDLLSALEETDPLRIYLEEVAATPTAEDPQTLAEKCAAGDETAPERLVNAMLGQVIVLAKEFTGRGVLLLDLCQEGGLALWNEMA